MRRTCCAICFLVVLVLGSLARESLADVVTSAPDRDAWESAAGNFTTIDFTEYQAGIPLSDQYAHLGVTFSGLTFFSQSPGFVDGHGMNAVFFGAWLAFSTPMDSIAMDFPNAVWVDFYADGELIYASDGFGAFAGFHSDIPFDAVFLHQVTNENATLSVDDLYFGAAIPAPGALALLAVMALAGPRRGRSRRARNREAAQ